MKHIIIAILAITLFACHSTENKQAVEALNDKVPAVEKQDNTVLPDTTASAVADAPPGKILNGAMPDWDKKIIRTANVKLQLEDYNGYNTIVHQSVKNYGAYIAQEQQLQSDGEISNRVSIKVPVEQFESLLNFISTSGKAIKILDKQVNSEDVSAEVVDTKSRIETKKKLRDKYFELMAQSKKMDDVIRVQNEISAITENIEAASGRVAFLSHQSAYSTINLEYFQVLGPRQQPDEAPPGFFTSFVAAFRQGSSLITGAFLFLVNIWPLVIGGFIVWQVLKRKVLKPAPRQ